MSPFKATNNLNNNRTFNDSNKNSDKILFNQEVSKNIFQNNHNNNKLTNSKNMHLLCDSPTSDVHDQPNNSSEYSSNNPVNQQSVSSLDCIINNSVNISKEHFLNNSATVVGKKNEIPFIQNNFSSYCSSPNELSADNIFDFEPSSQSNNDFGESKAIPICDNLISTSDPTNNELNQTKMNIPAQLEESKEIVDQSVSIQNDLLEHNEENYSESNAEASHHVEDKIDSLQSEVVQNTSESIVEIFTEKDSLQNEALPEAAVDEDAELEEMYNNLENDLCDEVEKNVEDFSSQEKEDTEQQTILAFNNELVSIVEDLCKVIDEEPAATKTTEAQEEKNDKQVDEVIAQESTLPLQSKEITLVQFEPEAEEFVMPTTSVSDKNDCDRSSFLETMQVEALEHVEELPSEDVQEENLIAEESDADDKQELGNVPHQQDPVVREDVVAEVVESKKDDLKENQVIIEDIAEEFISNKKVETLQVESNIELNSDEISNSVTNENSANTTSTALEIESNQSTAKADTSTTSADKQTVTAASNIPSNIMTNQPPISESDSRGGLVQNIAYFDRQEMPNGLTEEEQLLGKIKPFWMPDEEAQNCLHCDTKFTMIKRRHHCRSCGKVLCGQCCNFKSRLAYLEYKEARVCQLCYMILVKIEEIERINGHPIDISDIQQRNNIQQSSPESSPSSSGALIQGNSLINPTALSSSGSSSGSQQSVFPDPNNPSEYCSTVSPFDQASALPPPTVLVPVGVLKRSNFKRSAESSSASGERSSSGESPATIKQVMFSDGVRPGGDLVETSPSTSSNRFTEDRLISRSQLSLKSTGQSSATTVDGLTSSKPVATHHHSSGSSRRSKSSRLVVANPDGANLPPIVNYNEFRSLDSTLPSKPSYEKLIGLFRNVHLPWITFALTKNLFINVKLVNSKFHTHSVLY